jgi:hypothetical protein
MSAHQLMSYVRSPVPGKEWFVYFRIYGPQEAAFNGDWRPGDFNLTAR